MPQIFSNPGTQRNGGGSCSGGMEQALFGAVSLGELIRAEHGRNGVEKYVCGLNPLVPHAFLEQLCMRLQAETPPRIVIPEQEEPPPPPPQPRAPAFPPEQLLSLMQMKQKPGAGGGLDPAMLMKLLSQK